RGRRGPHRRRPLPLRARRRRAQGVRLVGRRGRLARPRGRRRRPARDGRGAGRFVNIVSRGFRGRRHVGPPDRVPPGQYLTDDFPVLSAGPTPHVSLEEWTFEIRGPGLESVRWSWEELQALPSEEITKDIHCV